MTEEHNLWDWALLSMPMLRTYTDIENKKVTRVHTHTHQYKPVVEDTSALEFEIKTVATQTKKWQNKEVENLETNTKKDTRHSNIWMTSMLMSCEYIYMHTHVYMYTHILICMYMSKV